MSTSIGKNLLDRLLESEVKCELLTLFHRNPGLIDSMDGISRRIGKGKGEVEADVKDFVEMGLLMSTHVGGMVLIRLNKERDTEIQLSLAEYFKSKRSSI